MPGKYSSKCGMMMRCSHGSRCIRCPSCCTFYHQLESFQTFTATLIQVQCRSFVSITGRIPIQCLMAGFFRGFTHTFHFPGRCRGKQEDNIAAYPCQCLAEHTFQLQEEREIKQSLMWCTGQATRAPQKAVLGVGWELWSSLGSALDTLKPRGLFGVPAKPQQCTGTWGLCWGQPHARVAWLEVNLAWNQSSGLCHLSWDPTHGYTPQQGMWARGLIQAQGEAWPLPQGAGEHPEDVLWQTPACPGALETGSHHATAFMCSAGHWLHICMSPSWESWLQTFAIYWIHIVKIELIFVHRFIFFYHIKKLVYFTY